MGVWRPFPVWPWPRSHPQNRAVGTQWEVALPPRPGPQATVPPAALPEGPHVSGAHGRVAKAPAGEAGGPSRRCSHLGPGATSRGQGPFHAIPSQGCLCAGAGSPRAVPGASGPGWGGPGARGSGQPGAPGPLEERQQSKPGWAGERHRWRKVQPEAVTLPLQVSKGHLPTSLPSPPPSSGSCAQPTHFPVGS